MVFFSIEIEQQVEEKRNQQEEASIKHALGCGFSKRHALKFIMFDDRDLFPVVRWLLGRLAAAKTRESPS